VFLADVVEQAKATSFDQFIHLFKSAVVERVGHLAWSPGWGEF
jgi:hypothetical protein